MNDPRLSLLFPPGREVSLIDPADSSLPADINLKPLVRALSIAPQYEPQVRAVLLHLDTDLDVIAYRQAVVADLLRMPDLSLQLEVILEAIIDLEKYLTAPQWKDNPLRQVAWRLSELEHYADCVIRLHDLLQRLGDSIQSAALLALRAAVNQIVNDAGFKALREDLPDLLPRLRNVRSITVGINLDTEMRPLSATLLAVSDTPYTEVPLMGRLFRRDKPADGSAGPLHDARQLDMGGANFPVELKDRNSPFMPPLFRDLSILLEETSQPIVQALKKYTRINSRFLIALKGEIAFYLGAVRLIERLQEAGLPVCAPQAVPADERRCEVRDLYNITLALQFLRRESDLGALIVRNDWRMDDDGRIFILTGPNQGGKTTYTQAVGLAQMLFQAGLHVPASHARMSTVDAIYTHFATEERPDLEAGRLGEEARRLNAIFQKATRHSLILLNESLASTAATESLYIARDVVRVLRLLGARVIFATHLHDLAADAEGLNAATEGDSKVISVVSMVEMIETDTADGPKQVRRTYKIVPAPPMSRSYAVELAARYGISYDQLAETLRQRRVID